MSVILNIETATTVCSVSLSENGRLLASEELDAGYTHAENLHVFIKKILIESGLKMRDIAAVAVSKGPGSYTGLRIGVSAAKGIAWACGIPLISVDTLQVTAVMAIEKNSSCDAYCAMIDARRMEVYLSAFDRSLKSIIPTEAVIIGPESVTMFNFTKPAFFGNGMEKCREILQNVPGAEFIPDIVPSARFMCALSYKKYLNGIFEDTAYFEPYYLKDFVAGKPKKK